MAARACQSLMGRSWTFGRQGNQLRVPIPTAYPADLLGAQSPLEASAMANFSPRVGSLPALLSLLGRHTPSHPEPVVTTVFRPGAPKRLTAKRPDWTPALASTDYSRAGPTPAAAPRAGPDMRGRFTTRASSSRSKPSNLAPVIGSRASARLSCCRSAHLCICSLTLGLIPSLLRF